MKTKITLLSIILAIIGLSSAFAQVKLDSGLVARYCFSGNANDESGHGYNGSLNGATLATDRFGGANSAYYFNGSSAYITVANSSALNPQNAISVCAWYYSEDFIGSGSDPIVTKDYTSFAAPYYQYKLIVCGNHSASAYYSFGCCVTTNGTANMEGTSNGFWTAGNWYFLACTYDGSYLNFYVNNNLIESKSVTGQINSYNTPLYFGGDPTFSGYAPGEIDDISIYNRALNTSEIAALYNESGCYGVGINEIFLNNEIKIYPNPTINNLTIESPQEEVGSGSRQEAVIEITNIQGQLIKTLPPCG
ncbi:MAG: LamG-like jellyroll fold domain-containing protein, partial [Bacteroidales bacterium]